MSALTELPNIGPVLADKLAAVGVETHADLAALGSVEVVVQIKEEDTSACYNMLYAIEGAILGLRWHAISKADRAALKERFDGAKQY